MAEVDDGQFAGPSRVNADETIQGEIEHIGKGKPCGEF